MHPSQQYARTLLDPHNDALCRMYDRAWERWEEIPLDIRADFRQSGRTVADCIWSLVTTEAIRYFLPLGIIPRVGNNTVGFPFKGMNLRFKKTDPNGKTSNYPTPHSVKYDAGERLLDVPEVIRVNVGWVPNKLGTQIADVLISCSGPVPWAYSILTGADSVGDLFDNAQDDDTGPIIRPRDDDRDAEDEETGSE